LILSAGVGEVSAQDESSSASTSEEGDNNLNEFLHQQTLTGGGEDSADEFGSAVAVSNDETTAIIGSSSDGTKNGTETGAAYVFTQNNGEWSREQRIVANDGKNRDKFGTSVSITGDGNTVLIGANGVNRSKGAVYEFTREENRWVQQEKFEFQEIKRGEEFGTSTAISNDGTTALIGAPRVEIQVDDPTLPVDSAFGGDISKTTGAVYLLEKDDRWLRRKDWYVVDFNTLYSPDTPVIRPGYEDGIRDTGDTYFGQSISLSDDGTIAIVGAAGDGNGSAYLLTRDGDEWSHQNISPDGDVDTNFGSSVSLTADGTTSLVVATSELDSDGRGVGAAYVIDNETGKRTRLTVERNSGEDTGAQPLSGNGTISSGGNRAVIDTGRLRSGTPFVFVRDNDGWSQSQELITKDGSNGDAYRSEVEFFNGGSNILISDQLYDNKGAVFEFEERDQTKSGSSITSNVPGFGFASAAIGVFGAGYLFHIGRTGQE